MARIEMNTTVRDLLGCYKAEQRIFRRCPHCQDVFRLSEAKLTYGKEPPRDVLTRLKKERDQLEGCQEARSFRGAADDGRDVETPVVGPSYSNGNDSDRAETLTISVNSAAAAPVGWVVM